MIHESASSTTRFVYPKRDGVIAGCVDRIEPGRNGRSKDFVQYRREEGRYILGLNGATLPLYRDPDVCRATERGHAIAFVEGEKKADRLSAALKDAKLAAAVTTIAGGANATLQPEHVIALRGAGRINVLADSDAPGRACAASRAEKLATAYPDTDVRIVDLYPDRDDGSDVEDWLDDGHDVTEMRALVDAAPRVAARASIAAKKTDDEEVTWGDARPWPTLDPAALHGLAGDFVRLVAPHSEADLSALISQFLAVFGCGIGSSAHVLVEATPHTGRVNVLVIGETAGGRKGTAKDQVDRIFRIADNEWLEAGRVSGLASGEGLIARLKDRDEGEPVEKRVLVTEPEFARTLAAGSRDGSILGAIIRDAWDSGRLQNLTRKEPLIAKGCHVSIIGHITADELRAKLSSTDIANGFFNRFIPVCAKRRQRLPHGGTLTDADLAPIAKRLRTALDFGRQVRTMRRTPAANAEWERFYYAVPEPNGMLGAVTARAEAQVLRLSLLYALLDGSELIDTRHLRAAIALWNYAHASAEFVFGNMLGDDVADRVLEELRGAYPGDCDRKRLHEVFSRHVGATRLTTALDYLVRQGLATTERIKTDGRPQERIRALPCEKSEISAISPPDTHLSSLISLNSQPRESDNGDDELARMGPPRVKPNGTESRL